ncbi:uncharacterized protein LOC134841794 [Symsagittifera roscoffensis]|uniref:uncharacterized protein LOC134841794 n=1 Tax=Symsagittifera roscoffensis TaxID=84072 RepID=UPI00307CC58C
MNFSTELVDSTPTFWDDFVRPLDEVETTRGMVMRVVWITWVCISLLFGVPGNLLVIASIAFMKHMRQLHHLFLANLGIFQTQDLTQISQEGRGLLKEALKEYRNQLRDFKDRSDRPMESKVRRLERHLFMRKFGHATLDEGVERNPSWEIELEEN